MNDGIHARSTYDKDRYDDPEHLREQSLLTCDLRGIEDFSLFGRKYTEREKAEIAAGSYVPKTVPVLHREQPLSGS